MLEINNNCTKCNICSEICVANIIKPDENKIPYLENEKYCIKCGHCEAVCPENALKNNLLPHEEDNKKILDTSFDYKIGENFLRTRRSIRSFKNKIVPNEETAKLLSIGAYAETGGNSQGISYLVISNPEIIQEIKNLAYNFFKNHEDKYYNKLYNAFSVNDNMLFRKAPMLILALSESNNPNGRDNTRFSLTYIEILAHTLGLGTCWAGFFERYTETNPNELKKLLEIPDNLKIYGALMYGYTKHNFLSIVERNKLEISFID